MMSQGVHSGEFHFFAVGRSHTELLPTGPGWSRLVSMEQTATAGEILLSTESAGDAARGVPGRARRDRAGCWRRRRPGRCRSCR